MKSSQIFNTIIDTSDANIVKIARKRSKSNHCDCSLPFLREKDNRCNICEKEVQII